MSTAIEVDSLRIIRGGNEVLHDISLSLPAGKVVGLLGPSGGGKSTLIRAIMGVQIVESGTVTVLGEPAGSPSLRSRIGYTTQSPSVYDDLSVADNVRYFAAVMGVRGAALTDAVASAIEAVDLLTKRDALVRNLSGGQRARVPLACAIVAAPELLVLDEPTVGLDPVLRRELWDLFHRLADQGTSLLVSSHVMDEASRCDHLVLLREGRVVADCTPATLLDRTGTTDAESAFLALIDELDAREGAA
ncbi:MAG: ABC transporter ATP-binding protein [Actinomycetia bacterium]|nr:ABC transporter ATP-binding protein [Actinomycetes bacterium]